MATSKSRPRVRKDPRAAGRTTVPVGPSLVPVERIERAIVILRGHKTMLDETLAELYGVPVKALNQAVKRNLERFPPDFAFKLTPEEALRLRSQTVTSKTGRGGRRTTPYAFTEQGVAMLSSVLRSEQAVRVNNEIMRTFVRLRQLVQSNADLARKLEALERRCDAQFKVVFQAIRDLMAPHPPGGRRHDSASRRRASREPYCAHPTSKRADARSSTPAASPSGDRIRRRSELTR
ncbi:MAG: ORF6N domain-containing protein [Deltaproteobacteria bacterium]|nr:ORF6N domain-containing protein [Deltaproteobacteria bacterium]